MRNPLLRSQSVLLRVPRRNAGLEMLTGDLVAIGSLRLLAIYLLVSLLFVNNSESYGAPPNIVLILADDLGYGDPGCYNAESKIPTPRIDALAGEGLRATDAHTPSSVCTPTRYGILTGRYAWRTSLKRSVLWPWDPPLISSDRATLPERLKERGYGTACIGKWHLGWDWPIDANEHVSDRIAGFTWPAKERAGIGERIDFSRAIRGGPIDHGFDHYFGDDVPNFPPYTFIEDDRVVIRPTDRKPRGMFGHEGPAAPGWDLSTVLPTIAMKAGAWIDRRGDLAKSTSSPFFLYVPLTAPHTPIAPSTRFAGMTDAGAYGDFVAEVDWVVGVVLDALDRNGLSEETLVIFTSDNGSPQRDGTAMSGPVGSVKKRFGHDPSRPWRGLKSDAWEGGHRVPFIVRWPGRIDAGTESDAPIVLTDLYRTLLAIAGVPVNPSSGSAESGEDSFDFRQTALGLDGDGPIRDHFVHHSGNGLFAIREGRYKLIVGKGSGGFTRYSPPEGAPAGQLYDLATDPSEATNLYESKPEIVARLSARLKGIKERGSSLRVPE